MSTEPHWSAPHPSGAPHPHPPHGYGPYSDPFAYRFYRSHSRLRGGWPRRVIWFGLGATAAVLYTRKHDSHSGEREKAWGDRWRRDTPPLADAPITSLATPVRNWDEEIEKVALLKRQAGHAVSISHLRYILFTQKYSPEAPL